MFFLGEGAYWFKMSMLNFGFETNRFLTLDYLLEQLELFEFILGDAEFGDGSLDLSSISLLKN